MHQATTVLAQLAAANAAVIMRELPDDDPFEHHLHSIELVTSVAVRMAGAESAEADFWEERCWEEVCARVAAWLVTHRTEMPDAVLAGFLGLRSEM